MFHISQWFGEQLLQTSAMNTDPLVGSKLEGNNGRVNKPFTAFDVMVHSDR